MDDKQIYDGLKADAALADALKERAENDFFFFCKAILRYKDVTVGCHKPMADFIKHPHNRKGALMPRAHLKTSILTKADAIHRPLIDPEYSFIFFNEKEENSVEFLYYIRNELKYNPIVNALWPDRIPDWSSSETRWSTTTADIKRKPGTTYYAPTYQALGMKGSPTSKHVHHIKFDDAYGQSASDSEAESKKIWSIYAKSDNLLISPEHNIDIIGTHWSNQDLYVSILENEGALFLSQDGKSVRGANMENPTWLFWRRSCYHADGSPIWPERFSPAALRRIEKKLGVHMFSLQMLNNPLAESNVDFNMSDVRYWEWVEHGISIKAWDHFSQTYSTPIYIDQLDLVQVLDPAVGEKDTHSFTAIAVVGMDAQGRIYLLDYFRDRRPMETAEHSGWLDKMYEFQETYQPRTAYFENVAFQKILQQIIDKRNLTARYPLPSEPINLGGRRNAKHVRIRAAIQSTLSQGLLHLHRSHEEALEEMRMHPVGAKAGRHYDLLDALAHAIPNMTAPMTAEQTANHRRMMQHSKSGLGQYTGYGFQWE